MINTDGTLNSWQQTTPLPKPIINISNAAATYKDAIYLVGGSDGSNPLNTVYRAFIKNKDGELSSWTAIGYLPNSISNASVTIFENKLYILGGLSENNTINNTVLHTEINDRNGGLGEWVIDTVQPKQIWGETVLRHHNRIYVIGGYLDNRIASREVFYATVHDNVLVWNVEQFKLPFELTEFSAVFTDKWLYILGGVNSGANQDTAYYLEIN